MWPNDSEIRGAFQLLETRSIMFPSENEMSDTLYVLGTTEMPHAIRKVSELQFSWMRCRNHVRMKTELEVETSKNDDAYGRIVGLPVSLLRPFSGEILSADLMRK